MAFTVTLQTADLQGSQIDCICTFDNGAGLVFKEHVQGVDFEAIKSRLRDRLAQLAAGGPDALKAVVAVLGSPLNTAAAGPPAPTAHDLFAIDVQLLRHMFNAIALGIKTAADKDYTDQQAKVKTALALNLGFIDAF